MTTWAVIATGASLTKAQVESVRGLSVVAISDAYKLAPWADVLLSNDRAWWNAHPEAKDFAGEKFCGVTFDIPEGVTKFDGALSGSNSGLLGIKVAHSKGATRILLLGFDMRGTHYFGKHPPTLKNTTPHRFEAFKRQLAQFKPKGCEIINCTPRSALDCYPKADLAACLSQLALHAA